LYLFQAGTFGAILEYGVEEKITDHSTLGATMVVGKNITLDQKLKQLFLELIFEGLLVSCCGKPLL
jgi:hypothetical protein